LGKEVLVDRDTQDGIDLFGLHCFDRQLQNLLVHC
jgi:hypothetical protein